MTLPEMPAPPPPHQAGAQLDAVLDAMADGVAVFNKDGHLVSLNRSQALLCGYDSPEEMKRNLDYFAKTFELRYPDGALLPVGDWPVSKVLRGESLKDWHVKARRLDMDWERDIYYSGSPVLDAEGKVSLAVIINRDMTGVLAAEKELRGSEERFRTLFESIDEGFCLLEMIFDDQGEPVDYRFLQTNPTFERHTGLANAIGKTARQLVPDLDSSWFRLYGEVVRTGQPKRFENAAPAMNRWFDVYAARLGAPEKNHVALVFKDISASKMAENALRESEERFRTLFESIDEGFCLIEVLFDVEGNPFDYRFLETNTAFENQSGLKNAIGRTIRDLVPGFDFFWIDFYAEIARSGAPKRIENQSRAMGRWFDVYATRMGAVGKNQVAVVFKDVSSKKKAEEELQRSEERLRRAQTAGRVGIWEWDIPLGRTFWSETMWELYGRAPDPALEPEAVFRGSLHPEDREGALGEVSRVLAAGEINYRHEFRIVRPDGGIRWLESVARIEKDPEGRPVKMAGINLDITERVESAARLRASERFTRHVLDNLYTFVGVLDLEGTILEANRAPLEFGGIGLEEVRGKKIWESYWWNFPGSPAGEVRMACERAAKGEVVRFDSVVRTAGDGRGIVDIQVAPLRNEEGRITHLIPSSVDVTERRRVEKELDQFALLVEASNDFIALADFEGHCSFLNAGGRRMVGMGPDAPGEGDLAPYLFDEDVEPFRRLLHAAVREGSWQGDFRFRHAETRKPIPVWLNLFPLRSAQSGEPFALALVSRDLTQIREKEEQLRHSQKIEAIGRLAGGVAHDFNNLLTAINGYAELLLASAPEEDEKRVFLSEIQKAGRRASALTAQLLAYSRKQIVQPRILRLNEIVEESLLLLRRLIGEHIEIQPHLDPDLLPLKADPSQIHQIILNLCLNARDAMPDGGLLRLETRNEVLKSPRKSQGWLLDRGLFAVLRVEDNGIGMDPEVRERIFEPFFTTKEVGKGTGLGLSSVYGIVQQSAGAIFVDSEKGKGSAFRIYLPALDRHAQESERETPAQGPARTRNRATILLVEDEDAVRKFARTLLEQLGYEIQEARDGEEALSLLAAKVQEGGGPDLLLSDVVMPKMSGLQLAETVARRWPKVRILLMSGYAEEALSRRGLEESEFPFVQKPFTTLALAQKIQGLLAASTQ